MNDRLEELGWQNHFEAQITHKDRTKYLIGRLIEHHRTNGILLVSSGEIRVPVALLDAEKLGEDQSGGIAMGDWFLLDPDTHRSVRRLDRKTLLHRKAAGETVKSQMIAANVDFVFIVSSCNQDFNLSRLERYLSLVVQSDATPVVVLTKRDLHTDPESLRREAESLMPGILVETLDARDKQQVEVLSAWCGVGKTIALLGSSGVGKSTLANTLCGRKILTQGIRVGDDKGRHTTTSRSMHRLLSGGWLIDNPGMRELQLADCSDGIEDVFDDIIQLSANCRFRDCNHDGDMGCAVAQALNDGVLDQRRLNSYLKLMAEERRNSESLAERRNRSRAQGRFFKRVISDKKRRRELN